MNTPLLPPVTTAKSRKDRPLTVGIALITTLLLGLSGQVATAALQDGALRMEVITAYNFVVDSNVESPSTNGPSAAHLGVKIYNDGATPITDVYVKIGDLTNPATSAGTPGTFPSRTVTVAGANGYSGTFALQMPGGSADALRYIPVIQPGEYVAQYFFVTYPLKDGPGNAVTGAGPDPSDDLWLNYDMWAYGNDGATTRRVDQTTKVTMRNEISAMANKIWPNTDGKVPPEYLDAIESSLGWRPDSNAPRTGSGVRLEGIWYDLGNVGAGFDNDGDGVPDRNAWMQPVGDPTPSLYNPLCIRLTKCYGLVVVKLNDGTEQLIPFEDRLYFENIPANNNGVVGLVYYEFMPLAPNCTTTLSPYQEVASGYDNEKFNGDYGTPGGFFTSEEPDIAFNKSGAPVVGAGTTATYTMTATNSGTAGIGFPELSLPLIFEDTIPATLQYVAGSATSSNTPPAGRTFEVSWSTDNGATWSTTEPVPASSATTIRWTLDGALTGGATATVQFQAAIPITYATATIDNTGCLKLGPTGVIACDPQTSLVSGVNSIGDLVWQDDDRDSVKDAGEPGIANVTVTLYYDANGDGVVDAGEPLYGTTTTNGSGIYSFANLPDGHFIVIVDDTDADLPAGFTLPNSVGTTYVIDLDSAHATGSAVTNLTADWPFISALVVTKSVTPTTYGAGELISYTIDLENFSTDVPPPPTPEQTSWSTTVTANRPAQNPANAQGAPDTVVARIDWAQSTDYLNNSGLSFSNPTGNITKVEFVFPAYLDTLLSNDELDLQINGTLFVTLTTAQVNAYFGTTPVLRSIDITSKFPSWTWADVQSLVGRLVGRKNAGPDTGKLWVDSMGFRVTTTTTPPPSGSYGPTTIDPLPLTDTFDNAKLAFLSATPPETSVSGGTITWANAGPLNPGQRKTITVTFRALNPPDIDADNEPDPTTTTNNATATNAWFVNGRRTNDDTDDAVVTINPRGEIGDFVFWDVNGNGTYDGGDMPLQNVRVTLTGGLETRTDTDGYYIFRSLTDGTYTVTIDTTTLPFSSFTQTKDPDATFNNASTVTINNNDGSSTNDRYLDRDFGYDSTLNVITGTIFQDNNGDGDRDGGENFLSGVTVTLLRDADSNGSYETTFATTTTNSSGFYSFNSLPNGLFRVVVTQPGSTTQTLDPDLPPGNTSGDNATNENASGGNLYANNDFAYRPTGALVLGDTLYLDWNGDGDQDSGEDGIASVDVLLYEDVDGDGVIDPSDDALIATATTNASGVYSFTGLVADDYIVVVQVSDPQFPAGVLQTQDFDGIPDSQAKVALVATSNNVDFGYKPQGTASIGDVVFIDADGDGVKDAGETGIANITVTLYEDTNNDGDIDIGTDAVVATDVSDASGIYGFSGLPAGNYLVDVDQADTDLPDDSYGFTYRRTTSDPHDVTLTAGQAYLAADFGFAASATIGDMVFFDANNNATQDYSEEGIPNVTVELWADNDEDGQPDVGGLLTTATTADGTGADPAGFYRFTNLPAGHYFVKVDTSTLPQVGGSPIDQTADPDRDGIPISSPPATPAGDNGDSDVIVTLGSNYGGADFGYQPAGVLGDFVWLDLDGDGVQDGGEPGIAGVAVRVTDGSTTYDVTTDFDGYWSVSNIADGTWTISVLASNFNAGGPLENMSNTFDADGGTNSSVSAVIDGGIVGATGNPWCTVPDCSLGIDFGYEINGSHTITGTVVIHDTGVVGTADDADIFAEDGTDFDLGPDDETELGGVPVYLYISDGAGGWDFIGSTLTDSDGNYSFSGLPDDDYRVIISTTATPLDNATLTTTTANAGAINPEVTGVTDTGTSVMQFLTIGGADVSNVDFAFLSNVDHDFGDLPNSFGMTTLAQDGARHIIPGGGSTLYFGTTPDSDLDGAPTSLADGDDTIGSDDESGVTPLNITAWTNGTVGTGNGGDVTINLTVPSGGGWLVGYVDFNQDGDFLDVGELILSQTVTTSGSADYAFDIPAGTIDGTEQSFYARFRVFADEPALPVFAFKGEADDGEVEDYLFTKPVGASIGNMVWVDTDGDGTLDPSESGLGGLTINLTGDATATMTTSDGTQDVDNDGITDPAGYYRFTGLAAGSYTVSFTLPAGYTPSYDEDGGTGSPDTSTPVTLATGEQHLTADFGLEPLTASISGQVRADTDSDGDLGDPDSGIPYVIVQLWTDPNGDGDPADGVQVGETLTDITGHYQFEGYPTGDYVIVELDPSGATSTADTSSPNDNRIPLTLVGGTDSNGNDFLDHMGPTHSISGVVYDDGPSDDNTFSGDDTTLPFVLVSLYRDINNNNVYDIGEPLLAQTLTNTSGAYTFTGLADANYIVIETDPSDATSEDDATGSPTDNHVLVVLAGADSTGNNFLDDGGSLHDVSGHAYHDYPSDGELNGSNEVPMQGVTMKLYADINNDGALDGYDVEIATTTTNSSGLYTFAGLPSGNYIVVETDPPGATSLDDVEGDPSDNTVAVALAAADSTGNDFLDYNPGQPGSISGKVWADTDNDDVGNTGIAGVVLTLLDSSGAIIDGDTGTPGDQPITATTNAGGEFTFSNVPPGSYRVSEAQPSGYASVVDYDGGDLDVIGDVSLIVLDAGEAETGKDFIEEQTGVISGTVWADTDNDDVGEAGIEDVSIALWTDPNGDGDPTDGTQVGAAITTNGDGEYSFPGVLPGSYVVVQSQPAGYLNVTDGDTTTAGDDATNASTTDNRVPVGIAAGETDDGNDFIEEQPGTISGTVTALSPLVGVAVTLFTDPNADGDPTDGAQVGSSVFTAAGGVYAFTDVPPGDYVVVESQPAGWVSVSDADTTNASDDTADAGTDNRIPASITAGETDGGNNFVEGCPTIDVTPDSLPGATVGTPYSQSVGASGGTSPYTYEVVGTLPVGLNLTGNTISGTPTVAGTTNFTIKATDANGCEGTQALSIVATCPSIDVTPDSLPSAIVGTPYSQTLGASGGTSPYTYEVVGTLPVGLNLTGDTISGTPTVAGTTNFTIKATDANGCEGTQALSIVATCPAITLSSLPDPLANGSTGTPYSGIITASGGTSPYAFALKPGSSLPPGLAISGAGAISGTPTTPGGVSFIIVATDANGCQGEATFTISVSCPTITVTPGTLADGVVGTAYGPVTFSQTGGTAPISWSLSGALPSGMSFTPGTATLGGTPTSEGTFNVTVSATDANNCIGSVVLSFSTTCPSIDVTPDSLPGATVGTPYSQSLGASGGTSPYSYEVVGTLPVGLNLTGNTISGTPTVAGTTNFTIKATDANGCEGTQALSIVATCPAITLGSLPDPLANGSTGTPYSGIITASGGTSPYAFALKPGSSLPAGLAISGAGAISGTPTTPGGVSFIIVATDANGCQGEATFAISVSCPTIAVSPGTLSDGVVGTAYGPATFSQTGGTAPISWSLSGALPSGMSFTPGTATLGGTPTSEGTFNITVSATDANNCIGSVVLSFSTTCPSIDVTPDSLPGATVGTPYSQSLGASGGTSPYTYEVVGTLPVGLNLTGNTISGTPTVAGTTNFTIKATDANGCEGTQALSIVATCPAITLSSLPDPLANGSTGTPYSGIITASGGTTPYAFALKPGSSLPAGLAISGAGAISGTPTTPGGVSFIIVATDANGCQGEATFTISVSCPTITVSPGTLADGVVGTAYGPVTFSQTGGTAPISWSLSGALPSGMSFTPATATLGGTPTSEGTFNVTVSATDANNCIGSVVLSFSTTCPSIDVTPDSLPGATVGTPYSQSVGASGGTSPYTYEVVGTLPVGLNLTGNTISGTPTIAGTTNFTIKATDANGCEGTQALSIVATCPAITLSSLPDPLANGSTGTPYSGIITASGGTTPYAFALKPGSSLPAGLAISGAGAISGTPTTPGGVSFIIVATDANGCQGEATFTISVSCPTITVTPGTLADGVVGTAYGPVTFSQTGGTAPISWSLSGALPSGMSFTPGTATLGGTPTSEGTFNVTVSATDANNCIGSVVLSFSTTCPSIDVTPDSLPGATVGTPYSQSVGASGGTSPYTYEVVGTLPVGLNLTGNTISGTPTVAGTTNFTIKATDANGCEGTQALSIVATCPSIDVTPDSLPAASVGTPYSQTLGASGGTSPYTYEVIGTLPDGLILAGNTISGTPTAAGTTNFIIKATDVNGCEGTQALSIVALGSTLGDLVWADENNNGLKDGSETGLDGVEVELLDGSGNSIDSDTIAPGVQPTVTTTAGGGLYSFTNVAPGNYMLRIATPPATHPISSSVTDTNDNGEDDDDNGSQSVAGGAITSPVIAIAPGENESTLDFGLVAAGSIGNLVWNDADNDGLKGTTENGINDVTLALLDALDNPVDDPNQAGVQPYTVTTSGGGFHTFTNLLPGNYTVRINTPPAAFPMSSAPTSSNDDGNDDDDNGTQSTPSAPVTSPLIALAHGESEATMDFGFTALAGFYFISGQVRDDYDVDGQFSDNDQPVPNVTMELYGDTNGNGTFDPGTDQLLATTTTDALGFYSFVNLPDGTYFVKEVDPNPSDSTADTDGPNDNLIEVTISSGDSTGNDFLDAVDPAGYIYSSVTGQIIPGGSISVSGPGTITINLDGSTGQYSFITDTAGTFTITYTPPAGYIIDPLRPVAGASLDPTGLTPDPYTLGSNEDTGTPGYLADHTSGGNPYYLTFELAPGDPFVINNNIPLVESKPSTFAAWQYSNPLGGQNGATDDPDGDGFTNLEEFAFCFTPQSGVNGECPLEIVLNGDGTFDAQVRRLTNYEGITYALEYIADLASSGANGAGWTTLTTITPSSSDNGNGTTTDTYAHLAQVPALASGRGYVRVRVTDTVSGTVARTYAAGWGTRALPAGCQTCSAPFLKCALFSGKVTSVVGSVLNVAASAGTGDFTTAFSPTMQYYIEVTSGDNAGHRFEVNEGASTATNLVLDGSSPRNTQATIPVSLANDTIVLREHLTIGEAYPPAKFTATNNPATADRMIFFNRSTGGFQVYWLFLAAGNPHWVLTGDGLLSQNDRVLDPCEGHFIHPRNNATSVTFTGEIRENAFACPLLTGTNFFAGGWPVDQSPNQRGMTLANGFTGTANPATSDRVLFWNGDTTPGKESYQSHFLLNAGARQQWTPQANAALLNENNLPLFDDLRSALLRATTGVNWIMPNGWTP